MKALVNFLMAAAIAGFCAGIACIVLRQAPVSGILWAAAALAAFSARRIARAGGRRKDI